MYKFSLSLMDTMLFAVPNGQPLEEQVDAETVSVSVQAQFDDADNKEGKRPEIVTAALTLDEQTVGEPVDLNTESEWTYTWIDLEPAEYTVVPEEVEGYNVTVEGSLEDGFVLVYTVIPEQEEIVLMQQTLTATVGSREIIVSGLLPEGAQLVAVEVPVDAVDGVTNGEAFLALDISVIYGDKKYEPDAFGTPITVTIRNLPEMEQGTAVGIMHIDADVVDVDGELDTDAAAELAEAVSDGTVETELMAAACGDDEVEFKTNGFSVYVFYTVNFSFNGYAYSMRGRDSVLLSDLFANLHIDGSVADVVSVAFTNTAYLSIEALDGDWQLTSLEPFTSIEYLSIVMSDAATYQIMVTDEGASLQSIINAEVSEHTEATVSVNDDYEENIIIPIGKTVTLNMNGHKLTPKEGTGTANNITVYGTLVLNGGTLDGAGVSDARGVLVTSGASFTLENATIQNYSCTSNGAGIHADGNGKVFLNDGAAVKDNTANDNGGGIYIYDGCNLIFGENVVISANKAGLEGGGIAIYTMPATETARDFGGAAITDNTAGANGGGLYFGGSSNIVLNNAVITDNKAEGTATAENLSGYGGGIFVAKTGSFSMHGGEISGNTASYGGGIYFNANQTEVTFEHAEFKNNVSTNAGGAIRFNGTVTTLSITDSTFDSNESTTASGGVMYAASTITTFHIDNSEFTNNKSNTSGGILFAKTVTIFTIDDSLFESNEAKSNGGVLYFDSGSSNLTINNCTFESNRALNGGAIYANLSNGAITVNDSTFRSNKASTNGGAMWITIYPVFRMNGGLLFGNRAESTGGAIYKNNGAVNMNHVTAEENYAKQSAVAGTYSGELHLSYLTVRNNSVASDGCLFWSGLGSATYEVIGGTYTENNCSGGRIIGAAYATIHLYPGDENEGSTLSISNNTCAQAVYSYASSVRFYGGEISNNKGNAIYAHENGGTYIYGGTISNNTGYGAYNVYAIYGGTIENNGSVGIYARYNKNLTIDSTAANIDDTSAAAAYIDRTAPIIIRGNKGGGIRTTTGVSGVSYISAWTISGELIVENNTVNNGHGAGLYNLYQIIIKHGANVTVSGNTVTRTNTNSYYGGGIYAKSLTLQDSASQIVKDNNAIIAGGIYVNGGDLHETSGASLTVSGNTSTVGAGGGVYVYNGNLTLSGTAVIQNNTANTYSGAVGINNNTGETYALTVDSQTVDISNNHASTFGGGIYVDGKTDVNISDGVIMNNKAASMGNDIYLTTAHNGAFRLLPASAMGDPDAYWLDEADSTHINTPITESHHSGDKEGYTYLTVSPAAKINDTIYPTLQDALDAARDGDTVVLLRDVSENVTTNANTFTLDLNGNSVYAETRSLSTLTVSENANLTLIDSTDAPGSISGSALHGVLVQSNASFTLKSGRISGNRSTVNGGGMYINGGNVTISGGEISDNTSSFIADSGNYGSGGSAIYIFGGTVNMTGGTISGNKANNNGNYGGCGTVYINGGSFTLTGGEISGNSGYFCAGVYVKGQSSAVPGTFTMDGGQIIGNTSEKDAGAIYAASNGTATVNDGEIANNSALNGSVYIYQGKFVLNGGTIHDNTIGNDNGAVMLYNSGTVVMSDGKIVNNSKNALWANVGYVNITGGEITGNNGGLFFSYMNSSTPTASISGSAKIYANGTYDIRPYSNMLFQSLVCPVSWNMPDYDCWRNTTTGTEHAQMDAVELFQSLGWTETKQNNITYYKVARTANIRAAKSTASNGDKVYYIPDGETDSDNYLKFTSLSEAFDAIKNKKYGDVDYTYSDQPVLHLMADVTESAGMPEDLYVTLNLNGHTLSPVEGYRALTVRNRANLTVCDEVEPYGNKVGGKGTITLADDVAYGYGITVRIDAVLNIEDVVFTGLRAKDGVSIDGAAIYNEDGTVNITGGTFTNNTVTYGGAIFQISNKTLTVSDATFIGNSATTAGAIYLYNGTAAISNCAFEENSATTGGAIYIYSGTATISDSTFTNNTATNGGAVYYNGGTITIDGNTFEGNHATSNGGAIWSANKALSIQNSVFADNQANNYGGAVYMSGSTVTFDKSILHDKKALCGGAIYGSTILKAGCKLYNNTATTQVNYGGGAIYGSTTIEADSVDEVTGDPIVTEIYGNVSNAHGGAVFGSVTVNGGYIHDNRATFAGGAFNSGNYVINDGIIRGNYAGSNGGAIYGTTITVNGGQFLENTTKGAGGAIYCTSATMNDGEFAYNHADGNGGAINGSVTMNGGHVHHNSANGQSGAMGTSYNSGTVVRINGGEVDHNTAKDCGGVGSVQQAYVTGGKIHDNEGSIGGVFYTSATVSVVGSEDNKVEIYNNKAATGEGGALFDAN